MSRRENSPVGVGVLTVLTVLLVLVLAVFSALTYATAKADLSLSRINADTVTAWYAAPATAHLTLSRFSSDSVAARRDAHAHPAPRPSEFEAGSEETLEATLPMTERQSLYVRFQWAADGTVTVLDWRTVLTETEEAGEGSGLPVYGWEG